MRRKRPAKGTSLGLGMSNELMMLTGMSVIPNLFNVRYEIKEFKEEELQEIELVRVPERGYYTVSAKSRIGQFGDGTYSASR